MHLCRQTCMSLYIHIYIHMHVCMHILLSSKPADFLVIVLKFQHIAMILFEQENFSLVGINSANRNNTYPKYVMRYQLSAKSHILVLQIHWSIISLKVFLQSTSVR